MVDFEPVFTAHTTGPLFDDVEGIVTEYMEDIVFHVAKTAQQEVLHYLDSVLQYPTGEYRSGITIDQTTRGYVVDDLMSVKGPWLEGISSRNPKTSFRGYQTWETVREEIRDALPEIIQPLVNDLVDALGGVRTDDQSSTGWF